MRIVFRAIKDSGYAETTINGIQTNNPTANAYGSKILNAGGWLFQCPSEQPQQHFAAVVLRAFYDMPEQFVKRLANFRPGRVPAI